MDDGRQGKTEGNMKGQVRTEGRRRKCGRNLGERMLVGHDTGATRQDIGQVHETGALVEEDTDMGTFDVCGSDNTKRTTTRLGTRGQSTRMN